MCGVDVKHASSDNISIHEKGWNSFRYVSTMGCVCIVSDLILHVSRYSSVSLSGENYWLELQKNLAVLCLLASHFQVGISIYQ